MKTMISTTFACILIAAPVPALEQEAPEPTQEDYEKALAEQIRVSELRHAALDAADRTKIPHLKDFLILYPDSVVQYSTIADGDFPGLSVTATLHDRYEFNMRIPVTYAADNRTVVGYGPPRCYLLEIESVDRRDDELGGTTAGGLQKEFGGKEWRMLVEAKGDFSKLGFELKKDAPVRDFDLVIKHLKSLERKVQQRPGTELQNGK